ncbi:hypothetical protein Trydic_g1236 [Trypoxylus dichotomus]
MVFTAPLSVKGNSKVTSCHSFTFHSRFHTLIIRHNIKILMGRQNYKSFQNKSHGIQLALTNSRVHLGLIPPARISQKWNEHKLKY